MQQKDINKREMLDSVLWRSFLHGDEEAFQLIYKTYVQQLFEYGCIYTQDRNLIQDHIHDVFVNLYKYRKKIKPTNNIKNYLFKSLKNSLLKALKKTRNVSYVADTEPSLCIEKSSEDLLIEQDNSRQRVSQVKKALSLLSDRQREALFLKFYLEYNYNEISQIMSLNYQSARNLVHRGIETLRKKY